MNFTKPVTFAGTDWNTLARASGGAAASGYTVDQFDPSVVDVASFLDKRAQHDGLDASDIFLGGRRLGLIVTAFGSTQGDFWDKSQDLLAAFSPTLSYGADTAALGFRALTFYQPTADIASWATSAYPDGIPLQYYARPLAPPTYSTVRDQDGGVAAKGLSKQFRLALLCRDPRKYSQTAVAHTITTSSTTATNLGDYPTPPTITINASTATGSMALTVAGSSFTVTVDGASSVYVVDSEAGTLRKDGALAMSLITTGVSWPILLAPGSNAVIRSGVAATSVTMSYRHAFA